MPPVAVIITIVDGSGTGLIPFTVICPFVTLRDETETRFPVEVESEVPAPRCSTSLEISGLVLTWRA